MGTSSWTAGVELLCSYSSLHEIMMEELQSTDLFIPYCICVALQLCCQFTYHNSMQHTAPLVNVVINAETEIQLLRVTATQMHWSMNGA